MPATPGVASVLLAAAAAAVLGAPASAPWAPAADPEPVTIAAIGDSITRATNAAGWYGDHPSLSWSTGFNPLDGLSSHYERRIRARPWPWPRELNVAAAGATIADAPAQARRVVGRGAEIVTFLLGANDLCAPSPERMTSLGEFRSDLETAMAVLADGLPEGRVYVASIPNVHRLWLLYRNDPVASSFWRLGRTCPSMLDPANTPRDRFHVFVRQLAFNYVLADVCSAYPRCVFDHYALYGHEFTTAEVSRLDYFHPSLRGQHTIAEITWRAWSVAGESAPSG
ncbi:MAG TPA: GDSL-type esterase/lipase family protein [Actinomycetota bacterium]|nr:GDSL-type esterase/lipase family protein [Actinomycetota bacterium]